MVHDVDMTPKAAHVSKPFAAKMGFAKETNSQCQVSWVHCLPPGALSVGKLLELLPAPETVPYAVPLKEGRRHVKMEWLALC